MTIHGNYFYSAFATINSTIGNTFDTIKNSTCAEYARAGFNQLMTYADSGYNKVKPSLDAYIIGLISYVQETEAYKAVEPHATTYAPIASGVLGGALIADGIVRAATPRASKIKAVAKVCAGVAFLVFNPLKEDPSALAVAALSGACARFGYSAVKSARAQVNSHQNAAPVRLLFKKS